MDNTLKQQIEFLIEIDKLKNITRKTKLIHAPRHENDAEHSWHLAMMALILQGHANAEVDLLKVFKMLLVHDLVEIDAGDTFAYDTKGHEDKYERELAAADRIFGLLPANQTADLKNLWLEFEQKQTAEAKFASALDRLQPVIHNFMNDGDTWQKYGITKQQVLARNKEIEGVSDALWAFFTDLIEQAVSKGILKDS